MDAVTATAEMTAAQLPPRPEGIVYRDLIDRELVVNAPWRTHGEAQGRAYLALTLWIRAATGRASRERHGLPELWLLDRPRRGAARLSVRRGARPAGNAG